MAWFWEHVSDDLGWWWFCINAWCFFPFSLYLSLSLFILLYILLDDSFFLISHYAKYPRNFSFICVVFTWVDAEILSFIFECDEQQLEMVSNNGVVCWIMWKLRQILSNAFSGELQKMCRKQPRFDNNWSFHLFHHDNFLITSFKFTSSFFLF
jgi:hypothetical protein